MGGLGLFTRRRALSSSPTEGKGYLKFADAEVFRILMEKGVSSDGVGITKEDAAMVTDINGWFLNNSSISSFNELRYFSQLQNIGGNTNTSGTFSGCTALQETILPESVKTLGQRAFYRCLLLYFLNLEGVITFGQDALHESGIEEANIPNAQKIGNQCFYLCRNLKKVKMRDIVSIENRGFRGCSAMESIVIDNVTPPLIASNAFMDYSCPIYVPDSAVEAYKTATNWSGYASRIKPLSEYQG